MRWEDFAFPPYLLTFVILRLLPKNRKVKQVKRPAPAILRFAQDDGSKFRNHLITKTRQARSLCYQSDTFTPFPPPPLPKDTKLVVITNHPLYLPPPFYPLWYNGVV